MGEPAQEPDQNSVLGSLELVLIVTAFQLTRKLILEASTHEDIEGWWGRDDTAGMLFDNLSNWSRIGLIFHAFESLDLKVNSKGCSGFGWAVSRELKGIVGVSILSTPPCRLT